MVERGGLENRCGGSPPPRVRIPPPPLTHRDPRSPSAVPRCRGPVGVGCLEPVEAGEDRLTGVLTIPRPSRGGAQGWAWCGPRDGGAWLPLVARRRTSEPSLSAPCLAASPSRRGPARGRAHSGHGARRRAGLGGGGRHDDAARGDLAPAHRRAQHADARGPVAGARPTRRRHGVRADEDGGLARRSDRGPGTAEPTRCPRGPARRPRPRGGVRRPVVVASKAREELGASRARPIPSGGSRSAVADPEPRAAELAAAGRRDQEIARHRHVSQKTVEVPSPAPTTSWGIPTAASVPRRSRGSSPTRAELAPGRGGAGPRSVALRPDLRQVVRMSVVVDRGLRGA